MELDEVYETDEELVLDIDDFKTLEEYQEYLASKGLSYEETVSQETDHTDAVMSTVLTPKALYKASLGENHKHAVQSFYIDGSDIYICQNYRTFKLNGIIYGGKQNGNLVVLSRCTLNGNTFTIKDSMLLKDVGHGQTLDMYTYEGKTYFLVSCGRETAGSINWSTQIGRITYSPNTILNNTDITRLTHLKYSNINSKSFGGIKRVDAALSADKTKLLIWKQSKGRANQFSVYDFKTINQQWSAITNCNTVSFQNNIILKNACEVTFDNPQNMPSSIQGIDLSNLTNNLH